MTGVYLKVFVDSLEKYRKLNDAEFGRLMRAALTYKATGEEVELMGREELLWDGMKLDINRDNERYTATAEARAEAGKKGAAARWQSNGKNSKCHLPYGKNGQDKDKEEDKDKKEKPLSEVKRKKFTPPTLEEVQAYCKERQNNVDPQEFIDFYTSKGWYVGKTPMKDWKAACRNAEKWERWEKPMAKPNEIRGCGGAAPHPSDVERMQRMLKRYES